MRPHINSFAVLLKKSFVPQVYLNAQIPTILKTFTKYCSKTKSAFWMFRKTLHELDTVIQLMS